MNDFEFYLDIPPSYFPEAAHSLAKCLCCEMFGEPGDGWNIARHPHNYTVLGFASEDDMQEFVRYWLGLLPAPVQASQSPF